MCNSERRKGLDFERQIARDLNTAGIPATRNCGEPDGQDNGVDTYAGVLHIQAKRYKAYAPISKLEEVPREPGTVPALVTRGDHKEAVICLYWSDFLELLAEVLPW